MSLRGRQDNAKVQGASLELHEETGNVLDDTADDLYNALNPNDQKALDEFVSCFKDGKRKKRGEPQLKRVKKTKHQIPIEDISVFYKIMEMVFDVLIQGTRRTYPGFKLLEGGAWPGLLHIAPGVFHTDYLKVSQCGTFVGHFIYSHKNLHL